MRRLAWITISIIVLLFLYITYSKFIVQDEVVGDSSEIEAKDKKQNKEFWEYYRLATKNRIVGEWEKGTVNYLKALDIKPDHEDALYYLGNMYLNYENSDLMNLKKAEVEFNKALELNKEETGPLLNLGKIYLLQDKDDLAKKYFTAVTGSNNLSVEAYFLAGFIAWKDQQMEDALSLFTNALKYAKPSEGMDNVGDKGVTKEGKSPLRVNQDLLFYAHIEELSNLEESNMSNELSNRYTALEAYINHLKVKFDNYQ